MFATFVALTISRKKSIADSIVVWFLSPLLTASCSLEQNGTHALITGIQINVARSGETAPKLHLTNYLGFPREPPTRCVRPAKTLLAKLFHSPTVTVHESV